MAIETEHKGIIFRSRLEARWAHFFDSVGWPWVYEPFDANGYIPDFLLTGPRPVLVEVKPAANEAELRQHVPRLVDALRDVWTKDTLIVGAAPHGIMENRLVVEPSIGLMWEGLWWDQPITDGPNWDAGIWKTCGEEYHPDTWWMSDDLDKAGVEKNADWKVIRGYFAEHEYPIRHSVALSVAKYRRRQREDGTHPETCHGALRINHVTHSFDPRPCKHSQDYLYPAYPADLDRHWANACNDTRWMPAR